MIDEIAALRTALLNPTLDETARSSMLDVVARIEADLKAQTLDLKEALEQQRATSEVLRVISQTEIDLNQVLESMIESAARLCGASKGHIYQFDGAVARCVAHYNVSSEMKEFLEQHPVTPGPQSTV